MANSAWKSGGQVSYTGDSLGNVPCGRSYQATGLLPAMYNVPRMPVCMFQFVKGFRFSVLKTTPATCIPDIKNECRGPGCSVAHESWISRNELSHWIEISHLKSLFFGTGTAK